MCGVCWHINIYTFLELFSMRYRKNENKCETNTINIRFAWYALCMSLVVHSATTKINSTYNSNTQITIFVTIRSIYVDGCREETAYTKRATEYIP